MVYGFAAGTFRNDHDVMSGMAKSMRSLSTYIVLAFFASQFIAYFNWTKLGIITAVSVITSYSIHYTKLYEPTSALRF